MNFRARLSLTNLEDRFTPTDIGMIDPLAGTYDTTSGTYSTSSTDPTAPTDPMQPVDPAPASPGDVIPTYDPLSPYTP